MTTDKRLRGFQPGQSGNPRGRPKGTRKNEPLSKLCRADTFRVYRRMLDIALGGNARDATAAGALILAYGWGRPHQSVDFLALHKFAGSLTPEQQEELGAQVLQLEAQQPDMFGFVEQPEPALLDAGE